MEITHTDELIKPFKSNVNFAKLAFSPFHSTASNACHNTTLAGQTPKHTETKKKIYIHIYIYNTILLLLLLLLLMQTQNEKKKLT